MAQGRSTKTIAMIEWVWGGASTRRAARSTAAMRSLNPRPLHPALSPHLHLDFVDLEFRFCGFRARICGLRSRVLKVQGWAFAGVFFYQNRNL